MANDQLLADITGRLEQQRNPNIVTDVGTNSVTPSSLYLPSLRQGAPAAKSWAETNDSIYAGQAYAQQQVAQNTTIKAAKIAADQAQVRLDGIQAAAQTAATKAQRDLEKVRQGAAKTITEQQRQLDQLRRAVGPVIANPGSPAAKPVAGKPGRSNGGNGYVTNLVKVPNGQLEAQTAKAFLAMIKAYPQIKIAGVAGAYRSYAVQEAMYNASRSGSAAEKARWQLNPASSVALAPPGSSTHGTGTRIDLTGMDINTMVSIAAKYGFVREFGASDPNHFMYRG